MYNIVIGATKYGEIIIEMLMEKGKLVLALDKKESFKRIENKKIFRIEVNIENVKLVESEIGDQEIESIYIATDDDRLNLMLGEQLSSYNNVNVILSEEKMLELAGEKYKVICPVTLVKDFILRGIEGC